MSKFKGIDISEHQGTIDWEAVRPHIDFAMIRLGYGQDTVDKQAGRNISECNRLGIPYGVYWFSYAYSIQRARNEANSCLRYLRELGAKLSYPVYFDWEYDSRAYVSRKGYSVGNRLLRDMAAAFCDMVEAAGHWAGIYANLDYRANYFGSEIFERYTGWIADITTADRPHAMHQYTFQGAVAGINGDVDMDTTSIDFPALIGGTASTAQKYSAQEQFVRDIQKAAGAKVDGIPGRETLSKAPTVSAKKNATHAVVRIIQARLKELGYEEVGKVDGIAGPKFTSAVAHYQQDRKNRVIDGELTAGKTTWRQMLGME